MVQFSCYATHMADTLEDRDPTWTATGDPCDTIRDFFKFVVQARNGRFDVHGENGKELSAGDDIEFIEQKTKKVCARAVVTRLVEGPHTESVGNIKRHIFLGSITFP